MDDETTRDDDIRQHWYDWEWLYQHGYLNGTMYAARRRLHEAIEPIGAAMKETFGRSLYWLLDRITGTLEWILTQMAQKRRRNES